MKFNSTILSILSLMLSLILFAYIGLHKSNEENLNSDKYIATLKDETIKLQQQVAKLSTQYSSLETQLNALSSRKANATTKASSEQMDSAEDTDVESQLKKFGLEIQKMKSVINKLNRRINKFDDSSDGACPFKISDRNTGRLSCVQ